MKKFQSNIELLFLPLYLCLCSLTLLSETTCFANVKDPRETLKDYFENFDKYENTRIEKAKQEYDKSLRLLERDYSERTKISNRKKIELLTKTAEIYRKQLNDNSDSNNRPNVLLNLAITLNELREISKSAELSLQDYSQLEVISLLKDIENEYPSFSELDKVLYMKASLLLKIENKDLALKTWQKLANLKNISKFSVYALIAIGDHYFDIDEPKLALSFFEKAQKQNQQINKMKFNPLDTKIEYRIAWSAYRAANLEKVKKATTKLLTPSIPFFDRDLAKNIRLDATELLSASLFEAQSISEATSILKRKKILYHAPALGFSLLKKYHGVEQHKETIELGKFLLKKFPLSQYYPQILLLLASSYENQKLYKRRIDVLEKSALLLPKTSLWRHRIKNPDAVRKMESISENAAEQVAIYNFDHGLANDNKEKLLKSASMYKLLTDYDPASNNFIKWQLRKAHSYFYAERLAEADKIYQQIKSNLATNSNQLQIAAYQLVLTREKQWRFGYNQAVERGEEPGNNDLANKLIASYEAATLEFVNQYPKQSRSTELLLALAGAFRDQGNTSKATQFWQRVLVSSSSPQKRSLAIRGVIHSRIDENNLPAALEAVKRFLALEDWSTLGNDLKNELLLVLSSVISKEAADLMKQGEIENAANVMVDNAKEVKDLPDKDKFLRDGAYNLAIAGNWAKAEEIALEHQQSENGKFRDDSLYLLARSQEYQLKFADAASNYYALAQKYPKHTRSMVALERAEKIASSEGNHDLAGSAAEMMANRTRDSQKRFAIYTRAANHYIKANKNEKSYQIASKAQKTSRGKVQNLKARILQAKILNANGQLTESEELATKIKTTAYAAKPNLGRKNWSEIVSEASFITARSTQEKFDTFHLDEIKLQVTISEKSVLFERLYDQYIEIIKTESPNHAPKARFLLAQSSEEFAGELVAVLSKNESISYSRKQQIIGQSKKLMNIAKKLHGDNLLAQTRKPSLYKNNPWIKKSLIKAGKTKKVDNRNETLLPNTVDLKLPSNWRM